MSFCGGGSKKKKATCRGTSYRSAQKSHNWNVIYLQNHLLSRNQRFCWLKSWENKKYIEKHFGSQIVHIFPFYVIKYWGWNDKKLSLSFFLVAEHLNTRPCVSKNISDPKCFWIQKFFQTQNSFGTTIFLHSKCFWTKKISQPIISEVKYLITEICSDSKVFWTNSFLDPKFFQLIFF